MKPSLIRTMIRSSRFLTLATGLSAWLSVTVFGAEAPVSWFKDVTPIFKRSCNGCHNPNKLKGEVDTSTYLGFLKPGKHGPNFVAGDPAKSLLLAQISGKEPDMPKEGDALSAAEVALITRWVQQGAHDDTPADAYSTKLKEPPTYTAAPVITSLAVSPDGQWLAVSGYHEVFLFDAPSLTLKARLLGESPRIESLEFTPDSKRLAVGAGAPARFGEVQIWDMAAAKETGSWKLGSDSLFGVSWSPDATRLAFGGADKSVRIIAATDGKEQMKFDNHSDWVFRTVWTADGKRLLSGSRDRAVKLIDASSGQFIDDINKLLEPVVSLARHPKEEWAAYGGAEGGLRVYKMKENQERTAGNNDVNLVREFERQPGPVQAVAFSPDGALLAAGGVGGEVRVYKTADGARAATLKGHEGAVFALAFSPDGKRLITGGFDGLIRVFDPASGKVTTVMLPIVLSAAKQVATR
jgi:mono/diheme cytochrome c family protein